MTSFSGVLELAHTASDALTALEETSNARVLSLFARYENGLMTYGELRIELLRQAKAGFSTAGAIAVEHVNSLAAEAGITRLDTPVLSTAPVLEQVLEDMRRNLVAFHSNAPTATSLRRLRFRSGLSVQTAVRRGFTENQLATAGRLRSRGATLKKVWLANFVNNTPCAACRALHGTEIPLSAEFPHGEEKSPKVYAGLQGPPRHPNCHCYMLVYVVTLETQAVIPEPPAVSEEKFMSSRDVRRLPRAVFTAAITTLRLIAGKLKEAVRGKR